MVTIPTGEPTVGARIARLIIGACLLLGSSAGATTYTALSLEDVAQKADIALYGTVTSTRVEEREGEPWTVVTFTPERTLKGEVGESLELSFYGGTPESGPALLIDGMPRFEEGETVLLFAYDAPYYSPVVGFSQGLWRLTGAGLRDETGRVLSLGEAGALEQGGGGAATEDLLSAFEELLEPGGTP